MTDDPIEAKSEFVAVANPKPWLQRIQAQGWKPTSDMPRDGRWVIAVCNDGVTVHRVSWGRARNGDLCWCEADRALYYGADPYGIFAGWIDCPQPGVA